MTLEVAALAVVAGGLVGVLLGAVGGGGSVLAVPVLVYLLDQSPAQATTGSLVVVAVTATVGAVAAHRAGNVLLARGVGFGLVALGGAVAGAAAATRVADAVLMLSFAGLLLVAGTAMAARYLRTAPATGGRTRGADRIVDLRRGFRCDCTRALAVLVTATAVGGVTGFLGVGGGFLVVPALTLVLAVPVEKAAGTSLVVIGLTAVVALAVRAGPGDAVPDWPPVLALTLAAAGGAVLGTRLAARAPARGLGLSLAAFLLAVSGVTAAHALPAVV